MTTITREIAQGIVREQGRRIVIPGKYTSIGTEVFDNKGLLSVVIPETITSIGDWAFYSNQLTSIDIPDSVTEIGIEAFAYNNLTEATIGDSVTTIYEEAFIGNDLRSVYIGDSVTRIDRWAFRSNDRSNPNLESISISEDAPYGIRSGFPYWSEFVERKASKKVKATDSKSDNNAVIDIITGTSKKDKLKGKKLSVHLKGMGGNDKLTGSMKDDVLDGGDGNDVLTGKKGADAYVLSSGKDKFKGFKLKEGDTIQIDSDITYSLVQSKKNTLIKHDEGVTTVFKVNKDELTSVIELVT